MSDPRTIEEVLRNPSTSIWLSMALQGAIRRDPLEAANDAQVLYQLLERRCTEYTPPEVSHHGPR